MICDADDPTLYASKGAKLLARNRPAEAAAVLKNAARLDSGNAEILAKLAEAQRARTKLAGICVKGDSLVDCNNALLVGEPDEFELQVRRGQLLLIEGRQAAALQAFISAQYADPRNTDLAGQLLELLGPAIRETPDDVGYLRARGVALQAIGSTDESIMAFRRAQRVSPEDEEIASLLGVARSDRARRVDRDCLSRSDPDACDAMILKGEPDEARIRAHMASVLRDANNLDAALTEAQRAAQLAPADASISALVTDIRARQAPPEPAPAPEEFVAAVDPEPAPPVGQEDPDSIGDTETPKPDGVGIDVPAPVIFSNAAREDGRTY